MLGCNRLLLRQALLLALLAAFSFGGTFTCRSDTDSDDFTDKPTTPAK